MSQSFTPLSGFPEYLPSQQLVFQSWLKKIAFHFEKYGFCGIETPAVEKISTLVSKGAAEHEIYTLSRYQENSRSSSESLGLRFDLTVPLARYVNQHYEHLVFPFKRYHIAPVWRGERAQKGRYRQFYQCDVDILSLTPLTSAQDAEIIEILQTTLSDLAIGAFNMQLNHKKLLLAILNHHSIPADQHDQVLRLLDKRLKISQNDLLQELQSLIPNPELLIADLDQLSGPLSASLENLKQHPVSDNIHAKEALSHLLELKNHLDIEHVDRISMNLSLARGLAYYTGIVFETFLVENPALGSIASGGRYDSLSEQFSSRKIPGVGMSIGVSRLFSHCILESKIPLRASSQARIMVSTQDYSCLSSYQLLARYLRKNNIPVDLYAEEKSLGQQMKYADKKGFDYVIMARKEEIDRDQWILKSLLTGHQDTYNKESLLDHLKTL